MSGCLFFNGPIVSMGGEAKTASGGDKIASVLVHDRTIVFVGELADARAHAQREAIELVEYDLEGAALLPGFIDGHLHPLPMIFFAASADLEAAQSLFETRNILRSQLGQLEGDEWLIGVQFEAKKLTCDGRLDRDVLDDIAGDRPALIYARDGHCVIVNSAVLRALGDDALKEDPDGGHIGRFEDGRPDGIFYEKAVNLPLGLMPSPSPTRMLAAGEGLFLKMAQAGVTSIGAMLQSDEEGPGGNSARMESIVVQALRDQIPQSIYSIVIGKTLEGLKALIASPMNDPDRGTHTRAFKIFADGTFGSCTACMSEPYADKGCTHGYMTLDGDEIYSRMEAAHLAGYQICIHAIGDRGIANCVDLFERLLKQHPRPDHRHRIEHASIADRALAERIACLGLGICTQPLFIRSEMDWLPTRLGEARAAHAYPFRDYVDAGICVGGSSDAPIEAVDVIAGIDFAVNRGGFYPEQGVEPVEAVAMYTRNAAWLQFEEDIKGSIEVGKQADLVILSDNPLTVPRGDIKDIKVLRTMIRGAFIPTEHQSLAPAGDA